MLWLCITHVTFCLYTEIVSVSVYRHLISNSGSGGGRSSSSWYYCCFSLWAVVVFWSIRGKVIRGVFRGGHAPLSLQSSIEWIFLQKKTGFVGTVLSTRSVLWTSNTSMPKMRPPQTPPGELTTLPRPPSRLGRGHPSQSPPLLAPKSRRLSFCGPPM